MRVESDGKTSGTMLIEFLYTLQKNFLFVIETKQMALKKERKLKKSVKFLKTSHRQSGSFFSHFR